MSIRDPLTRALDVIDLEAQSRISPIALRSRRVRALSLSPRTILQLAALAIGLQFLFMSMLSIRRHESFGSSAYDLGIVDQAVWNAAAGRDLQSSIMGYHFFGEHFSPILYLLVPLYEIAPDVRVALAFQSFALALAAVPLFLLARRGLGPLSAFGFVLLYLAYSPARNVALFDVHEIAFATPILFFACWFLETRNNLALAATCFLALLCKEEIGLVVAGIGIYLFFARRERAWGVAFFVLGMAWITAAVLVIIPHFRGTGYAFVDRYASLGRTPSQVLLTLILHPWIPIQRILDPARLKYIVDVFGPLSFLSFAAPAQLLLAAPTFFLSILSDQPAQYSTTYHYTAPLTPFVFYSAIHGCARLSRFAARARNPALRALSRPPAVVGAMLVVSLLIFARSPASDWKRYSPNAQEQAMDAALRSIPPQTSVCAQATLVPHLSQRRDITQFPNVRGASVICLDRDAAPWPIEKEERDEIVNDLVARGEYIVIREEGSLQILERRTTLAAQSFSAK